jgi:hypothetical protein
MIERSLNHYNLVSLRWTAYERSNILKWFYLVIACAHYSARAFAAARIERNYAL